ncbi:hypothetical protein IX329_000701 [Fusobacterium necrophorum]|nr:DUF2977 domain-containing protein [Fusobacterium necrophorum]MBR8733128.1 hypothetical protein [Fusobacterium necrophorum]MBR8789328.1 hypothetical protein [Fusobacterium necrophorum]
MKIIKIVIDENKRIKGYCDVGELPGSIEIEVEDDFQFNKSLDDYIYQDEKLVYSPNLEKIKKKINEKWKNERQEKIDADLEYKNFMFQMREDIDVRNFQQRALQVALGQKKLTDKEEWRLKDNTFKEFTYKELLEIVGLWGERKQKIWNDLKRMWKELEKANSIEEIEKIAWSEGI